jgi:hypothetical protein
MLALAEPGERQPLVAAQETAEPEPNGTRHTDVAGEVALRSIPGVLMEAVVEIMEGVAGPTVAPHSQLRERGNKG